MSAPNVGKEKKRRIKVSFIDLTLDEPSEILAKVLRINLKEFREMKEGERRNKIKNYLINKLRRAKEAVEEMEQELSRYS